MSTEISIVHGDTRHYTLSDITDDDGAEVDLSTGTLVFTAKEYVASSISAIVRDSGAIGGIVLDDTIINQAELEITAQDLIDAEIPNDWHTLPYELRFWRDGYPQTPLRGVVRVVPSIGEEPGS